MSAWEIFFALVIVKAIIVNIVDGFEQRAIERQWDAEDRLADIYENRLTDIDHSYR